MRITARSRLIARIHYWLFVILLFAVVGLTGWLSHRYSFHMDWTASGRNTLSEASRTLLDRLQGPIRITAYAREDKLLREAISELVAPYQRHKADIELRYVNPDTVPDRVRELGLAVDGELIVEYRGQSEHVQQHSERTLTNALQRVGRRGDRWLAYLTGHGERDLLGQANHDLGAWGEHLQRRGFQVQALNLSEAEAVPENTAALVIAGPKVSLLSGEVALIRDYMEKGGNLLWLDDPESETGLQPLAEMLGIEFQEGIIVDTFSARLFGAPALDFVLVTSYPPHPLTQGLEGYQTIFPRAYGIKANPEGDWESDAFLMTGARVWSETGPLEGEIRFDEGGDVPGPFEIGVALQRLRPGATQSDAEAAASHGSSGLSSADSEQRVVVIGDGDFLSNAYLGTGGNLDLGLNIINWLSSDDVFIAIPSKTAPDLSLQLSRPAQGIIGLGSLVGLPLILLGTGLGIWLRRRKR